MRYPAIDTTETGRRIRDRIRSGGYRVEDVSSYLGMTTTSLYRVFRGDRLLSLDAFLALSVFLETTIEDLVVVAYTA